MLIKTYITVALHCPECGKLDFHAISRFNVGFDTKVHLKCQCGTALFSMGRGKGNKYTIQLACSMCEDKHYYTYPANLIWKEKLINLYCHETGVESAFLGSRENVRKAVEDFDYNMETMVDDVMDEEFFNNEEIMSKVLEKVRNLINQDKVSCTCGNDDIGLEVNPDRVEIFCEDCGAVTVIFAENIKDLEIVNNLTNIVLNKGVFKYIDKGKKRIKK
ncbi:hypothetical protein SAMN00017405_1145 [Desulfonispora thiosulfatigenes DSM 11270]|uniref:Uncharacterized protein n=1 Tax=Desulfonispora thiosulfatigenes DSM 11270 TaxID=656914 RepID=A0A1W1UZ07_DESTI|nr:hypothetical protein [Desulfonispora thiosulfatigenes]SMB86327.1 hypothetical protein SAMN00017405_1145 [Desulfonispora thiosulfatigenes DSM 11270]